MKDNEYITNEYMTSEDCIQAAYLMATMGRIDDAFELVKDSAEEGYLSAMSLMLRLICRISDREKKPNLNYRTHRDLKHDDLFKSCAYGLAGEDHKDSKVGEYILGSRFAYECKNFMNPHSQYLFIDYLRKSADQGHSMAILDLGIIFIEMGDLKQGSKMIKKSYDKHGNLFALDAIAKYENKGLILSERYKKKCNDESFITREKRQKWDGYMYERSIFDEWGRSKKVG